MFKRKRDGRENLATEIINDLMEKLAVYRAVLCISLIGNVIMVAVLFFK